MDNQQQPNCEQEANRSVFEQSSSNGLCELLRLILCMGLKLFKYIIIIYKKP